MKNPASSNREKERALRRLLEDTFVLVHLDPTRSGVTLPQHLLGSPSVTLRLSKFFRGSLELEDAVITANLLFSGEYFTCVIPLDSIWRITSENGSHLFWPEDAPEQLTAEASELEKPVETQDAIRPNEDSQSALAAKGHLKRVK